MKMFGKPFSYFPLWYRIFTVVLGVCVAALIMVILYVAATL